MDQHRHERIPFRTGDVRKHQEKVMMWRTRLNAYLVTECVLRRRKAKNGCIVQSAVNGDMNESAGDVQSRYVCDFFFPVKLKLNSVA
jgi:hypothetical protein